MKTARPVLNSQEVLTSPPEGLLSIAMAVKVCPWNERQLRRWIALGRLRGVVIEPDPDSTVKRGSGRPTFIWIRPEDLLTFDPSAAAKKDIASFASRKKQATAPGIAATAPKKGPADAAPRQS